MKLEENQIEAVKQILLTGNAKILMLVFPWDKTPEGMNYWADQCMGDAPLDRDKLIEMLHENGQYPGKPLSEINPQKGDKLKLLGYVNSLGEWVENPKEPVYEHKGEKLVSENYGFMSLDPVSRFHFEVVREDKPKTWGEMTPEEKGAILLAQHEGKTIQWIDPEYPSDSWSATYSLYDLHTHKDMAYRVKPEPEVETKSVTGVNMLGRPTFSDLKSKADTHKLTYDIVDGVVDCSSVKLEEIQN